MHDPSDTRPSRRPAGLGLRLLSVAGVLAAALAAGACAPAADPPDVVLLTVDTLRADRLGVYGAVDTETPAFDRLAAEGAVFEQAVAPMPVTRPSHFTMFTGRYPREHGVTDNHLALPDKEVTLAEVFREAGYATAAFTGVVILGERSGAAQGFETFRGPQGEQQIRADEVAGHALEWLRDLEGDRPFFLWVHVYDPHMPYAPPPEHRPPTPPERPELETLGWGDVNRLAVADGGDVDGAVFERALALYGGEVEWVDATFGRLLGELGRRERSERTLTVLTADHGECFDHGYFFRHAGCLYDGALRVPLIVRYPGHVEPGTRIGEQVELLDLAPTVLELAGLDVPPAFGGRALLSGRGPAGEPGGAERFALIQHPLSNLRLVRGRSSVWGRVKTVRGEPMRPVLRGRERVGLRSLRWKYLRTGSEEELYDLAADPDEQNDLAGREPPIVGELRRQLRHALSEHPLTVLESGQIHPELREALESLGYL